MFTPQWQRFYDSMADGRFRITAPALIALEAKHPERVLVTVIKGNPAKVLLLDKPLQLKEKAYEDEINEFYLRRIPLRDVPGWPPILAPRGHGFMPPVMDCRLQSSRLRDGNAPGQEGMEFHLERDGDIFRAWMVGCPGPLLKCVQATLDQEGTVGKNLLDLQDLRLVSPES